MTFSGGVWYYRVRVRVMHLFRVRVNPKQIYFKHKKKNIDQSSDYVGIDSLLIL